MEVVSHPDGLSSAVLAREPNLKVGGCPADFSLYPSPTRANYRPYEANSSPSERDRHDPGDGIPELWPRAECWSKSCKTTPLPSLLLESGALGA